MYALEWNVSAIDDRDDIMQYIAQDNYKAAIKIDDSILAHAQGLKSMSERGRIGREPGTRELIINKTPYIAVYLIKEERKVIEIVRVLHGAQMWPNKENET